MMSNYIHYKVRDEIATFQKMFENGWVISIHILLGLQLFICTPISVSHQEGCSRWGLLDAKNAGISI